MQHLGSTIIPKRNDADAPPHLSAPLVCCQETPSPPTHLHQALLTLGCICRHDEAVPEQMLVKSIEAMGYQLEPSEVAWLAQRIGRGQDVRKSTLAAAHIDWPALLQDHR